MLRQRADKPGMQFPKDPEIRLLYATALVPFQQEAVAW